MDENLIKLDARLGALEILTRNLYADRFAREPDPVAAASRAVVEIERLSRGIRVHGDDPATNDMLAAEAADFLTNMFHEIVEIMRHSDSAEGDAGTGAAAAEEPEPWPTSPYRRRG